ncbi:MAG: efflux RND transporter periplasmic adaptor subunit [Pseudomonadota bacterium]
MRDSTSSPRFKLPVSYTTALIILGCVVTYFAVGTIFGGDSNASSDDEVKTRPPFIVLTQRVSSEVRDVTVTMRGRTEAGRRVTVRAETPGQVAELQAEEGQMVQRGDVLCRLNTDSRAALVEEANAALVKAETDFQATSRLFEEGFAAETALRTVTAARDAARARVTQARQELQNVDIKAPFEGLVAETLVEPGDVLSSGGACAVLADLSRIIVAGGVPAQEAELLTMGDQATIEIEGRAAIPARVSFVSDVADLRTRAFRVELITQNEARLSDGLNAQATIVAGNREASLIPRNALVFHDDGRLGVRVIAQQTDESHGEVDFIPVTLITETSDGAYVNGLSQNAQVIIRGQDYVSAGSSVAFTEKG